MEGIVQGKGTDSIFHFDADPDPDPDPDPTPSFTHVGKSENFLTFVHSSATLLALLFYWFLPIFPPPSCTLQRATAKFFQNTTNKYFQC
jgi:hypothetical protein